MKSRHSSRRKKARAATSENLTVVSAQDRLPLTCTREGTCCHGKAIWMNPWEVAWFAAARQMTPQEFRDTYTVDGGIRLRMDGPPGWRNLPACSQYIPDTGCVAHTGRPLACRLYPLGRRRQHDNATYVYEGNTFPCMAGCPGVEKLEYLTVEDYLAGQETAQGEAAQDAYLEVMQTLADDALYLFLDAGLAQSELCRSTLLHWEKEGQHTHEQRAAALGSQWYDALCTPELATPLNSPVLFAQEHCQQLETMIEAQGPRISTIAELEELCCLVMRLCLHLGASLGLDPLQMSRHWTTQAREHMDTNAE